MKFRPSLQTLEARENPVGPSLMDPIDLPGTGNPAPTPPPPPPAPVVPPPQPGDIWIIDPITGIRI